MKNDGTWYYFDPENQEFSMEDLGLGGVCLRVLSPDEYDRIQRLTVSKGNTKFNRTTGQPYHEDKVDERLAKKMRWDYCIVDWKGIYLGDEKEEAKCTKENKLRIIKDLKFIGWLNECLEDLTENGLRLEEARVKNLDDTVNETQE